jgi:hypothetical protein
LRDAIGSLCKDTTAWSSAVKSRDVVYDVVM